MTGYVAWLGGGAAGVWSSVAVGSLSYVERKAREVYASANWQEFARDANVLRITRGSRQHFVKSIVLTQE